MAPRTRDELLSYGIIDPALEEVCLPNHNEKLDSVNTQLNCI